MNGLPPTNPPLSCSEQMANTMSIPQLDTSYQILSRVRSECGDTDGEYLSTSTTPLNYMHHISPTKKDDSILLGNSNSDVVCRPITDINLSLNNLSLSNSADDVFRSQPAVKMQNSCLLYDKTGSDVLSTDYDLSCSSIDTELGINLGNRDGDITLSNDFISSFQRPPLPLDALLVPSNQRTGERLNSMYTSSSSTASSWEAECYSSSIPLPPPGEQWLQGAGAGAVSLQGSGGSREQQSVGSNEREFALPPARYPAAPTSVFVPQQIQQQRQSTSYANMNSNPPSVALRREMSGATLPYATARQAPLPIMCSQQSHQLQQPPQQQYQPYAQQPMTRSPPQLPMQQPQQYQQAGVDEAYYGAPARAVQQLQGYATAIHYGEVPVQPMPPGRSNVAAAGYRPSPMPMQHAQHHHYQQQHYQQGPAVAGIPHLQDLIYQVQFKRGYRSFTLTPRANFNVNMHDFVVVEGDRGEDIGIVVEVLGMQAFMDRRMNMPRSAAQQDQDDQNVGCILRLATLQERQILPDKFHTEKDIVQSCNELACYGFGLPIVVVDAELQYDRRKLTLYYDCSVRIDFRDFVRQLYATYKARIWMKKVDAQLDQPDVQPFAAMALATGVQFSQGSSSSHYHGSGY